MDLPTSYRTCDQKSNTPPKKTQPPYHKLDKGVCRQSVKSLSFGAKLLHAIVRNFAGENNDCYASNRRLAEEMGYQPDEIEKGSAQRAVQRFLTELEKAGLVIAPVNRKQAIQRHIRLLTKGYDNAVTPADDKPSIDPIRDTRYDIVDARVRQQIPPRYDTGDVQVLESEKNLKKEQLKRIAPGAARHPQGEGLQEAQKIEQGETEKIGLAPVSASPSAIVEIVDSPLAQRQKRVESEAALLMAWERLRIEEKEAWIKQTRPRCPVTASDKAIAYTARSRWVAAQLATQRGGTV